MVTKPFDELTTKEAEEVVKDITDTSNTEDQIRQRLTEAGFDGQHASIGNVQGFFTVMVYGPDGEIITN